MSKRQFLKDLRDGEEVDDYFSVKYKKPPREYSKGYMFEVRVADRSGEMNLKYWGPADLSAVEELYRGFDMGDVIHVRGRVSVYRDQPEIAVDGHGVIQPAETSEYDIRDFVPECERDVDEMMRKLFSFIKEVNEPHLSSLLYSFFSDEGFVEKFRAAPASMHLHSNSIGGLVEHTLNVVEICDFLCKIKPGLDRDLLLTGAILHDIGKIEEYVVTTSIDVSVDGMLRGHLVIGAEMVTRMCDLIEGFPELLKIKVAHMVLSSHGRQEFGSPKKPQFPEAVALYYADEIDSKLEQYISKKENARTEDPWIYDRRLEHIFLL